MQEQKVVRCCSAGEDIFTFGNGIEGFKGLLLSLRECIPHIILFLSNLHKSIKDTIDKDELRSISVESGERKDHAL